MTKVKLLENLAVRKLKLEVRMNRFKNWQKTLNEKKMFNKNDSDRSLSYWRKERRLNSRIEFLENKMGEILHDLETNRIKSMFNEIFRPMEVK